MTDKSGIRVDDREIGDAMVGEIIGRVSEDREMKTIIIAFFIKKDIFVNVVRERQKIASHIGVVFVERTGSGRARRKKYEVLGEIERRAGEEGDDEERKQSNFHSRFRAQGFFQDPESRQRCHQKNGHLGADRAERVRKSFVGEEFRCEHRE